MSGGSGSVSLTMLKALAGNDGDVNDVSQADLIGTGLEHNIAVTSFLAQNEGSVDIETFRLWVEAEENDGIEAVLEEEQAIDNGEMERQ